MDWLVADVDDNKHVRNVCEC